MCLVSSGVVPTTTVRRRLVRRFGHLDRRDVWPLATLTAASFVGTALAPVLQGDGLLIAMLSPRLVFLGLAAHQVPSVPFVILATLRLCIADPFHYRIGRAHGPAVLGSLGWLGRLLLRLGSRSWVVAAAVTLRPVGRHLMWAGTRRLNWLLVGVLDVLSTVLYCIAVKTGVDLLPI